MDPSLSPRASARRRARPLSAVCLGLAACSLAGPATAQSTTPAAPAPPAGGTTTVASKKDPAPLRTGQVQETPAQERYGAPRNPSTGAPVDTDLSKPLTLERAVEIGLQQHNSIAIAASQTEQARLRVREAKSSYYPQVAPSYQYQYSLTPGTRIAVGGGTVKDSFSNTSRTAVVLARQLLWDSGKREANLGQSRRNLVATQLGLGNQRQTVILSVTESYYNLLRDRELERVQEEAVRRAQTTLDSIKAQIEEGGAARSDTFQAEADLANAQVALLQARNNTDLSRASLKNAMGVVTSQPIVLPEERAAPPDKQGDTLGLERYVQQAYSDRLDVKQQQERIEAQKYSVRVARINNGLSVSADITEGYQLKPVSGEDRQLNISLSYPLFNGGQTKAILRESQAQLEQEQRTLDQIQQNIRLDVEQSYVTQEQARQRVVAAQTAVQAGQTAYDAALEKQQFGLATIVDVITAEAQLVNAQVSVVQAIYDYYIANARLQRDIGANDPAYVPALPGARGRVATVPGTAPGRNP
ncbi:MAG TPA: TolC family protein [Armatimonadota bacterium]